jgi:hypothetical protein
MSQVRRDLLVRLDRLVLQVQLEHRDLRETKEIPDLPGLQAQQVRLDRQ